MPAYQEKFTLSPVVVRTMENFPHSFILLVRL